MVERWNPYEIHLSCFMVLAVLSEIRECESLNPEGCTSSSFLLFMLFYIPSVSFCFFLFTKNGLLF